MASKFSGDQDNQSSKQVTKVAGDTNASVFLMDFGVGYQRGASLRKGRVIATLFFDSL